MEGEGKGNGGRGGEKGRGRSPPGYYGFPPGPRGARIVTAPEAGAFSKIHNLNFRAL